VWCIAYRISVYDGVGVDWVGEEFVVNERVPDDTDGVDERQRHEEMHVKQHTVLTPQIPAAAAAADSIQTW